MSRGQFKSNRMLVDHGDWQEWDIGSPNCPDAVLKIDTADMTKFRDTCRGRISAYAPHGVPYARFWHKGSVLILHREILAVSPGMSVDHINHDGLDNRRCNIRIATAAQNGANRIGSKNNSSGIKGVIWHKGNKRWMAQIMHNRKHIHLGYFVAKSDAIEARKAAEHLYFKEFAHVQTDLTSQPKGYSHDVTAN